MTSKEKANALIRAMNKKSALTSAGKGVSSSTDNLQRNLNTLDYLD
jgi:hypothetical protein